MQNMVARMPRAGQEGSCSLEGLPAMGLQRGSASWLLCNGVWQQKGINPVNNLWFPPGISLARDIPSHFLSPGTHLPYFPGSFVPKPSSLLCSSACSESLHPANPSDISLLITLPCCTLEWVLPATEQVIQLPVHKVQFIG